MYRLRSLNLSVAAGREAAKRQVAAFVEVSTGMVYKPDAVPRKETDKTKPWLKMAKWKLTAEEELAKIEGLNLVVMRLAHVYGEYSNKFVGTALCLARVYQHLGKEMKWLWDKDLRVNTVHVEDAARALWRAAEWYRQGRQGWDPSWGRIPVFNVVDHGNTCTFWPLPSLPRFPSLPTPLHPTPPHPTSTSPRLTGCVEQPKAPCPR